MISVTMKTTCNNAFVILTRRPHPEWESFANEIAAHFSGMDVFFVVDDNTYMRPVDALFKTYQCDANECRTHGYVNSNFDAFRKDVTAWEKALFALNMKSSFASYKFVWLVEDDVWIPSIESIQQLTNHAIDGHFDLVSAAHRLYTGNIYEWHWQRALGRIEQPWYCSMVCAIGLSRTMLQHIRAYVEKRHSLMFIEIMFNTLAAHHNARVSNPKELKTIVFEKQNKNDILASAFTDRCHNWYHAVKNVEDHGNLRKEFRRSADVACNLQRETH
jgi:hypothetical protein